MDSTLQAFWNVLEQSMGMDVTTPAFWIAVAQIIAIDILLGGDNAVVIALASRRLPDRQRRQAIFWGIFGAVAIRVVLIFFALQMLRIPFLKIAGGVLLFWIGVKLSVWARGSHPLTPGSPRNPRLPCGSVQSASAQGSIDMGNPRPMYMPKFHPAVATVFLLCLAGCDHWATMPESAGFGPEPTLPPPHPALIPTVQIAPAKGWPSGATPVAAAGLA